MFFFEFGFQGKHILGIALVNFLTLVDLFVKKTLVLDKDIVNLGKSRGLLI